MRLRAWGVGNNMETIVFSGLDMGKYRESIPPSPTFGLWCGVVWGFMFRAQIFQCNYSGA